MEFESVIRGRRSIRAYKPECVPEELVREILDAARWAPSWRNTQAWNVWVLTGDALQRYTDEFRAAGSSRSTAARNSSVWRCSASPVSTQTFHACVLRHDGAQRAASR